MGFTRFNCFRLHGISVALVSVEPCVGKSPWRIMFGFKGIANYKSPYGPFQLPSLKDQGFLSFFVILNQSTYTTRSWRFEVMHRRIFGGRRPFAVECCSQPPRTATYSRWQPEPVFVLSAIVTAFLWVSCFHKLKPVPKSSKASLGEW